VAPKVIAETAHLHPRVLQRLTPERDYSSPEVLREMAYDARRQGRARKQRGLATCNGHHENELEESARRCHSIGDAPFGGGDDGRA
jgi:hypothetical protein